MQIAREQMVQVSQNITNLVIFRLNQVYYAIAIEPIQQIIEMVTITPVLKTEAWMEGVINYHGQSVPVINLRRHFGLDVVPYGWHTPIILVNITQHQAGLIVDDVLDVLAIPSEQIVAPQSVLPVGIPEIALLKGIIQMEEHITLLLDLEHLFDQVQVRALSIATSALSGQPQPAPPVKTVKKKRGAASPKALKALATPPAPDVPSVGETL